MLRTVFERVAVAIATYFELGGDAGEESQGEFMRRSRLRRGGAPKPPDQLFEVLAHLLDRDPTRKLHLVGGSRSRREVHGDRIWVESEGAGQGSTFCLTLPGKASTGSDFPRFFPEHKDKELCGLVAAVDLPEQLAKRVLREGLYLARIRDDTFVLALPEDIEPRSWGS